MRLRYCSHNSLCLSLFTMAVITLSIINHNAAYAGTSFESEDHIYDVSFLPNPNYKLTTDSRDITKLNDHKYAKYPTWTTKDSVGWEGNSKVSISFKLKHNTGDLKRRSGSIYISTAKGEYAGVEIPKRIDVYTKSYNHIYHINSENYSRKDYADKSRHTLKIDAAGVYDDIILVIHSSGNYIFIDEIEWVEDKNKIINNQLENIRTNVFDDSVIRLKKYYQYLSNARSRLTNYPVLSDRTVTQVNCWSNSMEREDANNSYSVQGFKGEYEYICFELSSWNNSKIMKLEFDDGNDKNIEAYKIDSVMTSEGTYVFDPLVKIKNSAKLEIQDGSFYLLLKIRLKNYKTGSNAIHYNIKLNDTPITIDITALVSAELDMNVGHPLAINWAYTNDVVFNNHQIDVADDLSNHYINMFVIHPSHVPILNKNSEWNVSVENKLRKDLKLFKGRGYVLLYLGAYGWNKSNWLMPDKEKISDKSKSRCNEWIKKIVSIMKEEGYDYSSWYIYIQDEATAKNFKELIDTIDLIKGCDKQVQIYQNPTTYTSGRTSYSDLERMTKYIDLWQPQIELAKQESDRYFNKLNHIWCTYAGPGSPAKSAGPLLYKNISVVGWSLGASCFGFWAYSDTSGSSAWDDFDGGKPDYAVVYESNNETVSSLRWEAFADGIENYILLKHLEDLCSSSNNNKCVFSDIKNIIRKDVSSYSDTLNNEKEIQEIRKQYFTKTFNSNE